jgi:hypothetical protein
MKARALAATLATALFPASLAAECIPYTEAPERIGKIVCVRGTVVRVAAGRTGVTYLDFCDDYRVCPFVVVIFPRDLRQIGDVRQLTGKVIEISGKIKLYNDRPEIVLSDLGQLGGEARKLPPLPKEYDVSRHGNYSARSITPPKNKKKSDKAAPPTVFTLDPDR